MASNLIAGGGTNVGGGRAAGTTFTGDVGLSCDVDTTGSSSSSYAGADTGDAGLSCDVDATSSSSSSYAGTDTEDVGLSCDVDATGSSSSSYAGADSGEEGSSGRAGSDFGLDSDDDTREGDIAVVHSSEKWTPNSGKSIVKLSESDVTSSSKTFEIRRLLCRVLGPTGAILGRFNSVLARDALRMLPVSDIPRT
jgi:hypothetical protein